MILRNVVNSSSKDTASCLRKLERTVWKGFEVKRNEKVMNTVQPADTTPPTALGWCHYTHRISIGNSVQWNQQTQHHHLHLDGVTIHTAYQPATQYSATSRHNTTASAWIVLPYKQHTNSQLSTVQPADTTPPPQLGWCHYIHSISTGNSVQCNQQTQHHHLSLDGVTIHTAYQLATQYSATSRHNTTTSAWMVSPYTQHINWQLNTVQPAGTTPPPQLGWCHHTHSISTGTSIQCNQRTQHHQLSLVGVTIHTAYQLATQ